MKNELITEHEEEEGADALAALKLLVPTTSTVELKHAPPWLNMPVAQKDTFLSSVAAEETHSLHNIC
jgi:hypothetical protein